MRSLNCTLLIVFLLGLSVPVLGADGPDLRAQAISTSEEPDGTSTVSWFLEMHSNEDVTFDLEIVQKRNGFTIDSESLSISIEDLVGCGCKNSCGFNLCNYAHDFRIYSGYCIITGECGAGPQFQQMCICNGPIYGEFENNLTLQSGDVLTLTVTPPATFNDVNPSNNVKTIMVM